MTIPSNMGPRQALQPLPPEQRPATRADIAGVIEELRAVRAVLEEIRDQRK
jgi:hypothetical protein